eukprot:9197701-Karenia_brevis.AAC.1
MDMWSLKNLFDKWNRQGRYVDAGVLRMIAAGGVWTKARLYAEQDELGQPEQATDIMCERCHAEPDNDLHRFWTCKEIMKCTAVEGLSEKEAERARRAIQVSQHLIEDAVKGCDMGQRCFWLRGIIPACWTSAKCEHEEQMWFYGEARPDTKATVEEAYVDGSGTTSDPRLRRTGFAACWLDRQHTQVLGAILGNTPPDDQTVPYAELLAIVVILEHTTGPIHIWSDCEYT